MSMTMPYAPAMRESTAKPMSFDVTILGLWSAIGLTLAAFMFTFGFDANLVQVLATAG